MALARCIDAKMKPECKIPARVSYLGWMKSWFLTIMEVQQTWQTS